MPDRPFPTAPLVRSLEADAKVAAADAALQDLGAAHFGLRRGDILTHENGLQVRIDFFRVEATPDGDVDLRVYCGLELPE